MSTLRARKIWDDWQEWLSEPCEKGIFEGKPYVNYADPCSNAGEAKLIELIEVALAEAALRAETPTKHPDLDTIVIAHMKLRRVAKEAVGAMKETLNGATFAKGSTLVRLERVVEGLSGELAGRAETPAPRKGPACGGIMHERGKGCADCRDYAATQREPEQAK